MPWMDAVIRDGTWRSATRSPVVGDEEGQRMGKSARATNSAVYVVCTFHVLRTYLVPGFHDGHVGCAWGRDCSA
ncbi:hypothetical protein ACRALDRAFT_2059419 [Sodiomyces alcalophilus JCM 7366]|uniref:uncharacterized protein n=1 Tax=Sodiomyces alcalophilus JCM 7366 TaxID=591952 RepID=UPI0039B36D9E